jgi:hypothetical protein
LSWKLRKKIQIRPGGEETARFNQEHGRGRVVPKKRRSHIDRKVNCRVTVTEKQSRELWCERRDGNGFGDVEAIPNTEKLR